MKTKNLFKIKRHWNEISKGGYLWQVTVGGIDHISSFKKAEFYKKKFFFPSHIDICKLFPFGHVKKLIMSNLDQISVNFEFCSSKFSLQSLRQKYM